MERLELRLGNRVMRQKHTKLQIVLEIAIILIIFIMFAFLLIQWPFIPQQIPGHYNAAGQIDRWVNKTEIFALPGIAIAMYGLLTTVTFFPLLWNVPVTITKSNRLGIYRKMKTMLIILKGEILIIFYVLTVNTSMARPLPSWFLPVLLAVVFGSVIFSVIDVCKYAKGR